MKLIFKLCMLLTLLRCFCSADICNSPVYDGAVVLGGNTPLVEQAIVNLNAKGADAHALTVILGTYPTLDVRVKAIEQGCPSWQSPNGGVKSTLILLVVAPQNHQLGIYTGEAFGPAFSGGRMLRYRTQFMAPHFKAGEWSQGLIAAADQMSSRLTEFASEANTPVTNNTVNQASDYSGLWTIMKYLMFFGFTGLFIWIAISTSRKRKQLQQQCKAAQQVAIAAKNKAAGLVNELAELLQPYNNRFSYKPGARTASTTVDQATADFTTLANSFSTDPSDDELPVSSYRSIAELYTAVSQKLERAKSYLQDPDVFPGYPGFPPVVPTSAWEGTQRSEPKSQPMPPPEPEVKSGPTVVRETTVIHDSGSFTDGLVAGSILSERREEPRYREPEPERPRYREPDPEPEKDDFSKSSGSSSFEPDTSSSSSSSDSGSSSFSDSSSSSDFSGGSGSDSF